MQYFIFKINLPSYNAFQKSYYNILVCVEILRNKLICKHFACFKSFNVTQKSYEFVISSIVKPNPGNGELFKIPVKKE